MKTNLAGLFSFLDTILDTTRHFAIRKRGQTPTVSVLSTVQLNQTLAHQPFGVDVKHWRSKWFTDTLIVGAIFALVMFIEWWLIANSGAYQWVELFNGATFPELFGSKASENSYTFLFFLVLALRTLINLGGVLFVPVGIYWFLRGDLAERLMNKFEVALHSRDTALTGYLIEALKQNRVEVTDTLRDALYDAADKFPETPAGERFKRRVKPPTSPEGRPQ